MNTSVSSTDDASPQAITHTNAGDEELQYPDEYDDSDEYLGEPSKCLFRHKKIWQEGLTFSISMTHLLLCNEGDTYFVKKGGR